MAASWRRKRGRWSWQNQAGQGHEVDGIGRWPGHSTGSATGERFAGRSHAGGKHARASEGTVLGTRTAAQPAAARHRGSCLRLQPVARPAAPTRDRTFGAASQEPETVVKTGWPETAPLQKTLEGGAHLRLAAKLSPPARAPGPHSQHLSRLLSFRLLTHHHQVFMKPLLESLGTSQRNRLTKDVFRRYQSQPVDRVFQLIRASNSASRGPARKRSRDNHRPSEPDYGWLFS